ncbi:MAG: exodeoxyribonuclease III [Candidatus Omnitrophica bacterium]|nr:exodeoxyribonuclease III [Candidatus Omnitrophota bacterium]
MASTITILSWNVNGVRAVFKKDFLPWLEKESPDILCLQETKARPDQLPPELLNPEGYRAFWNSAERPGYSGVATFSRRQPLAVRPGLGDPRFDSEGRVLGTEFEGFTLFNIYFPNGKMSAERLKYKMDFYDEALRHFMKLRKQGRRLVVCGDVNTAHRPVDLARPKENEKVSGFLPIERAWLDQLVSSGFVDTFRVFNRDPGHYTWWDTMTRARERNVGWRIDYFFITEDLRKDLKNAFILPEVMGSDHCPVGLTLKAVPS